MISADMNLSQAPFHALRRVASFALLGAAIAGSTTIFPSISALAATVDLQAIGAVVGGVAGAITQVMRS
jgi:hypothetical protein